MSVAKIARLKKMKPAFTNPFCSVYIVSEGSIGETVLPMNRHWMMCAIMNRFRRTKARARHRLVFELRMPVLLKPGRLTTALTCPGIAPAAFNSGLTQPLFTELANLLQNALFATDQMRLRSPELRIPKQSYQISQDFPYVSNLPMTNITISLCPLSESTNNPQEQTQC
jgi:hypothetical protein